jgi:2-keto-4-pentenoate hydratase
MARQSAERARRLRAGATHRGWKVAFTTATARAAAGVEHSVVGYLTDRTELASGAAVELSHWTRPMIEAELAVRLSAPIEPDAELAQARAAIGAVAVAIEVVDVSIPLHELEEVLAGDVFHRHFLLGPWSHDLAGGDIADVAVQAWLDDQLAAAESAPMTVIGDPPAVLVAVAGELAGQDLGLEAGDVVMLGSVIALTPVSRGQRLRVAASGLGQLELSFTG